MKPNSERKREKDSEKAIVNLFKTSSRHGQAVEKEGKKKCVQFMKVTKFKFKLEEGLSKTE
jgi:hypothetical protein